MSEQPARGFVVGFGGGAEGDERDEQEDRDGSDADPACERQRLEPVGDAVREGVWAYAPGVERGLQCAGMLVD